jgi:hypothetical protein
LFLDLPSPGATRRAAGATLASYAGDYASDELGLIYCVAIATSPGPLKVGGLMLLVNAVNAQAPLVEGRY